MSVDLIQKLQREYDCMQVQYGDESLNAIYGGGCGENPDLCFVFMNPTRKNIASDKNWMGVRYQWLGTKEIWKFLAKTNLFPEALLEKIIKMKPADWTPSFCEEVYGVLTEKSIWITNLAKCTQTDARELKDEVFLAYRDLLFREIDLICPKKILLFGNQVASIVLGQPVKVSECRGKEFELEACGRKYPAFVLYYPVGNGRFNQHKAVEDLQKIVLTH